MLLWEVWKLVGLSYSTTAVQHSTACAEDPLLSTSFSEET